MDDESVDFPLEMIHVHSGDEDSDFISEDVHRLPEGVMAEKNPLEMDCEDYVDSDDEDVLNEGQKAKVEYEQEADGHLDGAEEEMDEVPVIPLKVEITDRPCFADEEIDARRRADVTNLFRTENENVGADRKQKSVENTYGGAVLDPPALEPLRVTPKSENLVNGVCKMPENDNNKHSVNFETVLIKEEIESEEDDSTCSVFDKSNEFGIGSKLSESLGINGVMSSSSALVKAPAEHSIGPKSAEKLKRRRPPPKKTKEDRREPPPWPGCPTCGGTCPKSESAEDCLNSKTHNGNRTFLCGVCYNKTFSNHKSLRAHLTMHAGIHKCEVCAKSLNSASILKEHMRKHTGEKPFTCETCGKSFTHPHKLKIHIRVHTSEKPYVCHVCQMAFTHNQKLKNHMFSHGGTRRHVCELCPRSYDTIGHLKEHMRVHTGEKPHICETCGHAFRHKQKLKKHVRAHLGVRPHQCEVCAKTFLESHELKVHTRIHTGELPYSCTICRDSFKRNDRLQVHMRIAHTGERPYVCEYCSESFADPAHFSAHLRLLHEKTFHECGVCMKVFASVATLRTHVLTHTGRLPYPCTVCHKTFLHKFSLEKHKRLHTNETLVCPKCDKCFVWGSSLVKHMRKVHEDNAA